MLLLKFYYTSSLCFLTLFLICSSSVYAAEDKNTAEWTMGVGLGVFDYHHYPGAKNTRQLFLPVPYFTFRSPKLEIDHGIKTFLYHSEKLVLDISADFALPVDSDDTLARQNMPDLDLMLQLGPSAEFLLNKNQGGNKSSYFDVRFELPLRAAFATDFRDVENIGYLLEPRFTFNHRRSGFTGLAHKATLGLKFATQEFHAYYYDVGADFATATRPEYNSSGGFGGAFAKYRISYKTNDFVYWAFLRYQFLHGAEFDDSPLVIQKDYYFVGVGFAWIFAKNL